MGETKNARTGIFDRESQIVGPTTIDGTWTTTESEAPSKEPGDKHHPYEPGTPLAVFFDAAHVDDSAWLRDWEVESFAPDPAKFGDLVQIDGDLNFTAGIRAVMDLARKEAAE